MLFVPLCGPSPLDGAFFRRIDFGALRNFAEQKTFNVVEQEVLCVWTGEIQTIVINDLCLFLQPFAPARLADLRRNSLPERIWEWRVSQGRTLLTAMCALDVLSHIYPPC